MTSKFTVAAILLSCLAAPLASAQSPGRGELRISQVSSRGNGCRSGSVAANVSPDGEAFTLLFSDYSVDSSTRAGRAVRKKCKIDVTLDVPPGWSFTLLGLDVRGYGSLERGVVGVQKIFFSIGRERPKLIGRHVVTGPFDNNYQTQSRELQNLSWSACRGSSLQTVNLDTAVIVRPQVGFSDDDGDQDDRKGTYPVGMMAVDSLDGSLHHRYAVAWKRCR